MAKPPETVREMEDRLRGWNAWWWAKKQAEPSMFSEHPTGGRVSNKSSWGPGQRAEPAVRRKQ